MRPAELGSRTLVTQIEKSAPTAHKESAPDAPPAEAPASAHVDATSATAFSASPTTTAATPVAHTAPAQNATPAAPAREHIIPPPPAAAAAHDIKLQAGEGEQRVEVRVTERGGDVFVAVRTPDSRLAGNLRQDLPTLSGKLEQSGFHATTWHPAATAERERMADPSAASSGQDSPSQQQNGREQQRDPEEQKQKGPANPASLRQSNKSGEDFAWLLSSIR